MRLARCWQPLAHAHGSDRSHDRTRALASEGVVVKPNRDAALEAGVLWVKAGLPAKAPGASACVTRRMTHEARPVKLPRARLGALVWCPAYRLLTRAALIGATTRRAA